MHFREGRTPCPRLYWVRWSSNPIRSLHMSSGSSARLTPKQLRILTLIRDYQRKHGYSPTMQELADTLGVTKVTVFEHVTGLEKKGLLRRSRHRARSLELTSRIEFPDEAP